MTDPIRARPVQPTQGPGSSQPQGQKPQETGETSFADTLSQKLRFSTHAQKRLERRNISLSDDGLSRLADAVDKAEKRGGRESLVLVDDLAFIVNVQERLVVTALDRNRGGDGVFTQIDSVVFADKPANENPNPVEPQGTTTDDVKKE